MAKKSKSIKDETQREGTKNKSEKVSKSNLKKLKKSKLEIKEEKAIYEKKAKKLENRKGKKSKLRKIKEVLARLVKKEKKVSSKLKAIKKDRKEAKSKVRHKTDSKPHKKVKENGHKKNIKSRWELEAQQTSREEDHTLPNPDRPLNHSSIDHNVKEAAAHIRTISDLQDIDIYVLGDKRLTVQKAAEARKNSLIKNQ